MISIYGIIGSTLILCGSVYFYIFLRYLVKNKDNTEVIVAVSETLITIAIGVFYIYSVVVLSNYSTKPENFTNNIDDILLRNDSIESYFVTKGPVVITELIENPEETQDGLENAISENSDQTYEAEDDLAIGTTAQNVAESLYTEETPTVTTSTQKTTLPLDINKTEQFIKNYQSFIKEAIKNKFSNSSLFKQTLANIKFGPPKIKTSRDIKIEPEEDSCFYNFFIGNALLLYSFTHCLLTLINNSLQCRKCIETKEEPKVESQDSESSVESKNEEVLDTSGSASAPVGPLFESTNSKNSNIPDLKLFEAKCIQSRPSTEKANITVQNYEKYKLCLQISLTWLLPITAIIVLYFSTKIEQKQPNFENHIKTKTNFVMSSVDPNVINIIGDPVNVTTNSSEVDNIVNKIYNIVNKAKADAGKKTTYLTPAMVDTVYFLNQKQRDPKDNFTCSMVSISIKILYFLVFIVGYFGVILFAKITETVAKFKNQLKAKQQSVCFLSFTLLWLPSVLDIFYRMFVSHDSSDVISSIFLALGNVNRLQTLMSNHMYVKKYIKANFINPV